MSNVIKEHTNRIIIYVLLFLIGLNFQSNAVVFCYVLALVSFFSWGINFYIPKISLCVVILVLFILISQVINDMDITIYTVLKLGVYPIMFFSFYRIGKGLLKENNDVNECLKSFAMFIFFFALGNVMHMLLDMSITDLFNVNMGNRVINDIWTGGTAVATIVAGWGCITPPVLLYAFEKRTERKCVFLISLVLVGICLVFSFVFATRMILVNFIFVIAFYVFLLIRQKDIKFNNSLILKILLGVIVLGFAIYKLSPYIQSSNLFARLSGDSLSLINTNGRNEATIFLLEHFTDAIWGGEYFTAQYGLQQHNILFQMYDLYGVIPFVLLAIMFFKSIKCSIIVAKSHSILYPERRFMLLLYVSLMMYYFEEPALTSNLILTSILFAFIGFVCAIQCALVEGVVINGEER